MGRIHTNIIGRSTIAKTPFGRPYHCPNCSASDLDEELKARCGPTGDLVAIAGPTAALSLRSLAEETPLVIEDEAELLRHPFAQNELLRPGWIVLGRCVRNADRTYIQQRNGCHRGTLEIPSAVALVWALVIWHKRYDERLFGKLRLRTASVTADRQRVTVQQKDRGYTIRFSLAHDSECAPDLVATKQYQHD